MSFLDKIKSATSPSMEHSKAFSESEEELEMTGSGAQTSASSDAQTDGVGENLQPVDKPVANPVEGKSEDREFSLASDFLDHPPVVEEKKVTPDTVVASSNSQVAAWTMGEHFVENSKKIKTLPKLESDLFGEAVRSAGATADSSVYMIPTTTTTPLEPVQVEDVDGRISGIINSFSSKIGSRIVPESFTRIPRWVSPRDHDDFISGTTRFFVSKGDSKQVIQDVVNEALDQLRLGRVYTKKLSKKVSYEGKEHTCYELSPEEVKEISTLLSVYGPKAVNTSGEESDLVLVIGDYIHG